jgi:chemotaxis protein methyltransferase CheR
MKGKLKEIELSNVCEMITARMGLYYPKERWDILVRNLTSAAYAFGYEYLDEFINWLLKATLTKNEIETLASYLTVSETFFWREPQVFSALTDFVLPELIAAKRNREKKIKIWSAGCSTGEEPYSLAILLHKIIPDIKDWEITILATDINQKSLDKALSGIYTQWSFRNSPSWLKPHYFQNLKDGRYEIIPTIRNRVTFSNLNLTEEIYPSYSNNTESVDIIFCRNVLMYFSEDWINKIAKQFFHSLTKGGWFVVSSCELSSEAFVDFAPVNFPGAILYNKDKKKYGAVNSSFKSTVTDTPYPFLKDLSALPIPKLKETVEKIDFTLTTAFNLNEPKTAEVESTGASKADLDSNIPDGNTVTADIKIRALANAGNLIDALSLCNEEIAKDKLAIGLYFIRASVFQELNQLEDAIASLKQAIYLDPDFIMGHFTLGNLFIGQGKPKQALKYFNNVIDLLNTLSNDDIIPESEGLSVMHIREIIETNMQKHSII